MSAHSDHFAPTPPCDGCEHARRCALELLACEAFRRYSRLERWHDAQREPTPQRFQAIFSPRQVDDAVLARLRAMKRRTKAERGTRDGRRPQRSPTAEALAC